MAHLNPLLEGPTNTVAGAGFSSGGSAREAAPSLFVWLSAALRMGCRIHSSLLLQSQQVGRGVKTSTEARDSEAESYITQCNRGDAIMSPFPYSVG